MTELDKLRNWLRDPEGVFRRIVELISLDTVTNEVIQIGRVGFKHGVGGGDLP